MQRDRPITSSASDVSRRRPSPSIQRVDGEEAQQGLLPRTMRYVFVGAICAVVNNAVIILGDLVGWHYLPMTVFAFVIVTCLGYVLHCRFTFAERSSLRGLMRFAFAAAASFPLSVAVMASLCSGLHLPVVVATPVATVVLFLWNYAAAHWAIIGRDWFRAYRPVGGSAAESSPVAAKVSCATAFQANSRRDR